MFEGLPFFPEQASKLARDVDAVYIFLISVSGFFVILIAALVIVFAIKYRRRSELERPRPITGSILLELVWTIIPFIIAMSIFAWGASIYFDINRPPAGAMEIWVVGKQWMWKFQHLNGTREINELHVPVNRAVRLTMASEDVIHSLFFPTFRVKGDVIPGRYRTIWFEATKPGRYHIFCAEYCGTKHSGMIGWVTVMEPGEFQTWLSGGPVSGTLAESGERLFTQLACNTCHLQDRVGRGPVLTGVFGKDQRMQTGEIIKADESYLRDSILNPQSKILQGFQPIMPTYQGQISEEGLLQLIAYIKSMKAASEAGPESGPVQTPTQMQPPGEVK
jgi:cytochrome c oxidase subunit 2